MYTTLLPPPVVHLADLVWADEWTKALHMVSADMSLLPAFHNVLWYRFSQAGPFFPLDKLQGALTDICQPLCLGAALGDSEIQNMVDKKWIKNSNGTPVYAQNSVIDIYPAKRVVVPAGEGVIEVQLANLPQLPVHVVGILEPRSCIARRGMGSARKGLGPLHVVDNDLLLDANQIVKSDTDRQAWNLYYSRKSPQSLYPENPVFSLNLFYLADDKPQPPNPHRQWVNVKDALRLLHLTEIGDFQPVRARATSSREHIEAARRLGDLILDRRSQAITDDPKVYLKDFRRNTNNYSGRKQVGSDGIELWDTVRDHALPRYFKGWILNSMQNVSQEIDMVTHGAMFDLPGSKNTLTLEVSSYGSIDIKDINPRPPEQPRFWPQGRKPYRQQYVRSVVYLLNQVVGRTAPYRGQFHLAKRARLGSVQYRHATSTEGKVAVAA